MKSTDSTKEENASGSWGKMGDDFSDISYSRKPLLDFLGFLLDKNKEARFIVNDKQKADFKIDVFFSPGKKADSTYMSKYVPGRPNTNFLIHLLSKTFQFRFSQQSNIVKGYRLVVTDTVKLKNCETLHINPKGITHASESDEIDGIIEIANHSIADIAITIEQYLKYPVKNETGTNKHYDVTLNVKNITEANKQLVKYGLSLVETTNEPFEVVYLDFY